MEKKEALKIVQKDGIELINLPAHYKKDREIVLEAVKTYGDAIAYADESLRNDPDILAVVNKKK